MVATSKRFSFALRLDDGTLISGCKKHTSEEAAPVVCLKPEEAFEKGYLQEADLLRAQAHLCEVHAKLPEAGPLKSVSTGTKRSLDSVLEVGQAVSGKRSRSTGGVVAPANGYHDTAAHPHAHPPKGHIESPRSLPAPPPPAPAAVAPVRPAAPVPPPRPVVDPSVASFGMAAVNKIIKMLGKDSWIFTNPVNAAAVPDYYDIIKNPICLADIKQRLSQGYYHNMAAFYEDMYLLVSNCFTYNKIGTPVYTQGQRIEKMFNMELRKAGQGLLIRQIKKQPRTAASRGGHRVVDDEDDDYDYRPAAPSKRPGSQRVPPPAAKAKSRPGAAAPRAAGKAGGGVARTKSVNSYKAFQPLPEDKQAQLAEALSDEAVLTEKMEGVVEILQRANELGASEDGEVELDLTVLSPQTVWQLYEYIFGPQQAAAPERAQRSGSGFQLEQDSDYDPMGDSDEDL